MLSTDNLPTLTIASLLDRPIGVNAKSTQRKETGARIDQKFAPKVPHFPWREAMWRIWAKALGEKSGADDGEADKVAVFRSLIVLCYIVTNAFIIAGIIRHW